MSPEQARGKKVDKRADIWAFGVVLYEMLTGTPLFKGETVSDVLAAVLTRDPDWSRLPKETPSSVRRLLGRLLERDPKRRLHDIGDALQDFEPGVAQDFPGPVTPRSRFRWVAFGLVAAALGSILTKVAGRRTGDGPQPSFRRPTFRRGTVFNARFAPDGASVLYTASWEGELPQVFSSRFDGPESSPLDLSSRFIAGVASGEVAFIRTNRILSRAPLGAGTPREVLEDVRWADWTADGSKFAVVRRVGGRDRLEFPPGTILYETVGGIPFPRISPSQDRVAFWHQPLAGFTRGFVRVVDLAGKELTHSDTYGSFSGLAWHGEEEVWYSAGGSGEHAVRALSLSGRSRDVLRGAGSLTLHDISKDGRLLITQDKETFETSGLAPGTTKERDLTWLDRTYVEDLTPDGRFLMFHESGWSGST